MCGVGLRQGAQKSPGTDQNEPSQQSSSAGGGADFLGFITGYCVSRVWISMYPKTIAALLPS